ncbi:MAG: hypothetical protein ACXVD1_01110, partial [Nocardioides sp.]
MLPRLIPTPLPRWEEVGAPVSVPDVLAGATGRMRRALAPGLRVRRAFAWEHADRHDPDWWPQGITPLGRLMLVSWYSKAGAGVRISFVDLRSRRYTHVPLALPNQDGTLGPLPIHAGGLAASGSWVHVAATGRGIYSAHLEDLRRLEDGALIWPVRLHLQAPAGDRSRFRYSFLSVSEDGELIAGEYGRGDQSTRLARFALDADGLPAEAVAVDAGVPQMQGAILRRGRYLATVSHGTRGFGGLAS